MEALRFSAKEKQLQLVNVPVPKISDSRDVLVKVAYSGVCGTDLHIIGGEFPCNPNPVTLGHEFSGTVVEIGSHVTTVRKGDRVSLDPNRGCHVCNFCRSGTPHFCKIGGLNDTLGIFRNGGWADYVVAPEEQVYKLPETLTLEQAALTEPLSCLTHGWDQIQPVTVGKRILVIGAGIIGNLWLITLHLQGHRKVTVSEPNATRRQLVEQLETGFDCISPDTLKQRQRNDPNYLFDLIVDCSGFAPATEHAVSLLNHGGKLCIFGVAPPTATMRVAPFELYEKEATIVAVKINPLSFPNALGLMESFGDRYLNYNRLGVKTFALNEYQTAIDLLKKGSIAKAVFKL